MAPSAILSAALALAIASVAQGTAGTGAPGFPPRLEEYLTTSVAITAGERKALLDGAPVTRLLDADEREEIGVFGAVWIDASPRRYVDAVSDIESFERGGGFTVTKRISSRPVPTDFAALRLPDDDIKDLRDCRVGDCVVKLDEQAIRALREKVDWKAPNARDAVDAVMREFALLYVSGYLEGGNRRLAVYRDRARPTFVAEEFSAMIGQMPELGTYVPQLRRYLLDFPAAGPSEPVSFLYWQETEFGLRPTIRISHLSIWESAEGTAVASKMLYASHYFWTGLELRVLLPDPPRGPGFWFVTVSRSRSDGLTGFTGRVIRGRVRKEVQKGTLAALRATKRLLEADR
jgi:hypothetical protein